MEAIIRSNLADRAVQAIRAALVSHRWNVGDRLPNEATLSAMLSVSRGTVREAVRVLVAEGYLQTRQGSGTYVLSTRDRTRPLTMARRASLRDQFEARLALDVEAVRLAAHRHTPDVIATLRRLLAERGSHGDGDRAGFIERDLAFHKAVVAAARNQALVEIYDFFSASITETIEATVGEDVPEPDIAAHAAIIDAIASGDPHRADAAVRQFMAPVLAALDRMLLS